ncbi:unnamed protein product [Angiostrongylus costaricensis]|uniref:Transmembrane protein n=1 Tax=Angiostrongylus costaricensis TaxID=334426 RepID=A0A0R3PS21_ANGCS|nr:unnamed protein product [Angiostrongylus costaricensis]
MDFVGGLAVVIVAFIGVVAVASVFDVVTVAVVSVVVVVATVVVAVVVVAAVHFGVMLLSSCDSLKKSTTDDWVTEKI